MFGPIRGNWPDDKWKGWWGEDPPFHVPVFVLTHHKRESISMKGGTTFHFVTQGINTALEEAKKVTGEKDIRIGGGVQTIRQFLLSGYVDEIHLALSPIFLGAGEHLFSGIDMSKLGYHEVQVLKGERAIHVLMMKNEKA
jgi:dihydrofolate reductase